MRKCKEISEVAVMEVAAAAEATEEVGVRMTRARAKAAAAASKRNKRELNFSSPLINLKHRRKVAFTEENSTSPAASKNSNDQAITSCCSSNTSTELVKKKFEIIDLQEEEASSVDIATSTTYELEIRESRETTPSREFQAESVVELDSTTARPSEANSFRPSTAVKMPSEAELEDFFSTAEKKLEKQFAEKYNFDIVKEEAVEGRYEWIRVNEL